MGRFSKILTNERKRLLLEEKREIENRALSAYIDSVREQEALEEAERSIDELNNQEMAIQTLRETYQWGTFGRTMNEDLRVILLKDISDSHLVHIIGHLILHRRPDILITMLEEARYRSQHNIFVPDYE